MTTRNLGIAALFACATVSACSGGGGRGPAPVPSATPVESASPAATPTAAATTTPAPTATPGPVAKIDHVVVIVQENRSFDDLFQGYPGADTAAAGMTSTGQMQPLVPQSFAEPADISHAHTNWYRQYAGGKLFFDLGGPNGNPLLPYSYVPQSETVPYWTLAGRYTLADRMFQSNTGPSFIAHQYLIAGSSQFAPGAYADENPTNPNHGVWGCDSPSGTTVPQLGQTPGTDAPGPAPCFDYPTLGDELDAAHVGWRYYAPAIGGSGFIWSAYDAIAHIRNGPDWSANVVSPETTVLADAQNGTLAPMTWVVPSFTNSDHAGSRSTSGPQWVASIVNAIGAGPQWNHTAIFITWDDWGGWYDHVAPPQLDAMGLGFRVPLLVVSPYAKRGYVSHVTHEFGSILKFAEKTFGVAPLAASDARADDLGDAFDFTQSPAPYVPLAVRRSPGSFAHAPEAVAPDDDR